jgi:hypothetical protein
VAPLSAVLEGITRYGLRSLRGDADSRATSGSVPSDEAIAESLQALREFLLLARHAAPRVIVVQHLERAELYRGGSGPGGEAIRLACETLDVETVSFKANLLQAINEGHEPYRDDIHLTAIGQEYLARAILTQLAMPGEDRDLSRDVPASSH